MGTTAPAHHNPVQKQAQLAFVLDTNLELPTDKEPWKDILANAGITTELSRDLVKIDSLLAEDGPDLAYTPGADFCRMLIRGNSHYDGLVIATSKFTGQPSQRTLLVVRQDDRAKGIEDLEGAAYGYMNQSCSSSYFPPAILLNNVGKDMTSFWKGQQVAGWQTRVDAVVSQDIRATMILEDVWKMDPKNAETCKIIGQMDGCPPAILMVKKTVDPKSVSNLREHLLLWMPDWETTYGAFRPFVYADVQTFSHLMSKLPADI